MGHSIQVENIAKNMGDSTLAAAESVYPSSYGEPLENEDPDALVERWESEAEPTVVHPGEPGYI